MKKGAVIVETRLLDNLKEIIDNHLMHLPEDWGLMMFGSEANRAFFETTYPTALFVSLGKELNPAMYNEMLTSEWFWNTIPFDKILIFQHDSRLLREGIEEFLEWDYVGAPWKFQSYGGNGGLSLRTKKAMLDIIEYNTLRPEAMYNEDVFFCNKMKEAENNSVNPVWRLASREVCEKFSVETIYQEGTLGCHAIEKYLTPLQCDIILSPLYNKIEKQKKVKSVPPVIDEIYSGSCKQESDINQHLPKLKEYAEKVNHITEFGFREVVSTYAFLAGLPKQMISYDIVYHPNIKGCQTIADCSGLNFNYKIADVLKVEIEPTDLLFIDTLHTYTQLKQELKLHAGKVRKYLIFHDTETYAFTPEPSSWQSKEVMDNYVENDKGIWPAIEEFLTDNPQWKIVYKTPINNGLTILEKV